MLRNLPNLTDTIVAPATAPGEAAIAVIRLSGENAVNLLNSVFRGKDLTRAASHTIHFGTIIQDNGSILDEVLVSIFLAPKSYTKENVVEISCHGSVFIQQQLLDLLVSKGARLAAPGEFTLRAYLNGRFDLSQAEAVADLIHAQTAGQQRLAMNQMRGGYSAELARLRQQLLDFTALIELELDFSEEDVEFADRSQLLELLSQIKTLIEQLMRSFRLGNVIRQGVPTVIAGRPNAGKSALLNALLKEERAIVSPVAGTTRDTIEEGLTIDGILFRLIDTAGIREATDAIEAIGVQRTWEKIESSSLVVYVYDAANLPPQEVEEDIQKLKLGERRSLIVANKTDLLPPDAVLPQGHLSVSAKEGRNLTNLTRQLVQAALQNEQVEDITVSNIRHYEALAAARAALDEGEMGLHHGLSGELVALHLRDALRQLGSISGEIDMDTDVLGTIFGRFCIGK